MLRLRSQTLTIRRQFVEAQHLYFKRPCARFINSSCFLQPSPGFRDRDCARDGAVSRRIGPAIPMGKRKSHSSAAQAVSSSTQPASAPAPQNDEGPPAKRRASQRIVTQRSSDGPVVVDPGRNTDVLDGAEAWRASPDADGRNERMDVENAGMNAAKQIKSEDEEPYSLANGDDSDSPLSDISDIESPIKKGTIKKIKNESGLVAEAASGRRGLGKEASLHTPGNKTGITTMPQFLDPEADGEEEPDEEELQAALSRPPPVNSDYLPLPWRGRLGYVYRPAKFPS